MNPRAKRRRLEWAYLGRVPYGEAERLQWQLRDSLRSGDGQETLLLLEHPHVITLGRNASREDVLVDDHWCQRRGVEIVECDRGGRVTYHGPGQLVGYPIIDLTPDRRDIRRYVHDLMEVLVRVLRDLGVRSQPRRSADELGLWVESRKIASIGVHISRWITTHGFALNVDTDLDYFSSIVPCGLKGIAMTSVAAEKGRSLGLPAVGESCSRHFAEVFDRSPVRLSAENLSTHWPVAS